MNKNARAVSGMTYYSAVVVEFYVDVLRRTLRDGALKSSDKILVVCGGETDRLALELAGFSDITISNIAGADFIEDAEQLSFQDRSFDAVVVHAGLHHCRSPHRALLEMYRVARKCVVALEARDSLVMRAAVRLGLTEDYEMSAIVPDRRSGGLCDTGVPNFIYRWTERDVRRTILSFDPARINEIKFHYRLRLPIQRFARSGNRLMKAALLCAEPLANALTALLPKQCNEFAFVIVKREVLQPWMATEHQIK